MYSQVYSIDKASSQLEFRDMAKFSQKAHVPVCRHGLQVLNV